MRSPTKACSRQTAPLHAGFARWLERNGKGEEEHAALLAHHYAAAVLPEDVDLAWPGREREAEGLRTKAVWWSRQAAELAIGRYEIDQGLALLRRAVSLETEPREQAAIWQRIGQACALRADPAPPPARRWMADPSGECDRALGRGPRS